MTKNIYPHIRKIPPDAWKKKAWPITQNWEEIKPILMGKQIKLFEFRRQITKTVSGKEDPHGL